MKLFGKNFQRFWFNFEVKNFWMIFQKIFTCSEVAESLSLFFFKIDPCLLTSTTLSSIFSSVFSSSWFFLFDESSQNYRPIFNDKFLSYKYFTCTISESCIDFSSLSLETLDFTFFTFLSLITASVSWTSVLFSSF